MNHDDEPNSRDDHSRDDNSRADKQAREPIFNVPWPVLIVTALIVAVHVLLQWLPPAEAEDWLIRLAFIPARYAGYASEIPGGQVAAVTSFVTHMLVHGDATHLAINAAWFLAFGSVMSRRVGWLRFLAFVVGGGLAGAIAFLVANIGALVPVVGASGAIAALMGGVMRFLFTALDRRQGYLLREAPERIALMPLATTLTDRRVIAASALFVGINLLALVGFGLMGSAGAIAWEAHLGGYAFGLLAFGLFDAAPQRASPTWSDVE